MRISLLILSHLLCLSLPTTGIGLGRRVDTGTQPADNGVVETSGDAVKAGSWASFLNPSYIIESIKNATEAFVAPKLPPVDFWETAREYEELLQEYVPRLLGDAAEFFESTGFTDVTSAMYHIVNSTATFRENIQGTLDARDITFDTLTEELEGVFAKIMNDLPDIPPPDQAHGHAERAQFVDQVLDDIRVALVNFATRHRIDEEVVTSYLIALKPHVQALVVTVGDLNEQHPDLFPVLAFGVVCLLIPEEWILGPLLSMFGFGPAGPIKGSAAAWLQSRFWGSAIKPGSWFSLLQKVGMGGYSGWAGLLVKVPLLLGLFTTFLASLQHQ